jgi:hypothetical protein
MNVSSSGVGRFLTACAICLASLNSAVGLASAAELRFSRMISDDTAVYRLEGAFLHDDPARLGPMIDVAVAKSKYVVMELGSPGGDLPAAMEIGRMVKRHLVWTKVVDFGSGCYSACVLVLAAGSVRLARAESKIGIHRPRFDETYFAGLDVETARSRYASMAASVRSYLDEMGISPRLFDMMMQVSSSSVRLLTQEELKETGLDGSDPGYDEWLNARANSRVAK